MTTLLTLLAIWFVLSTIVALLMGQIIGMQNSDNRTVVTKTQPVNFNASTETTDTRATAEIKGLSFTA